MIALTHERLKHLLHYNPETGVFTRLVDTGRGRHKAGSISGTSGEHFRFMWVDGKQYLEHRIAWLWMTGALPKCQIDHRDRNGLNNRWENLREATPSQNGMNRKGHSGTGVKGVYSNEGPKAGRQKKWRASIAKDGRSYWLGTFRTIEEAAAARAVATLKLHGEFARVA